MNFNKKALNDKSLYMIHSKYRDNLHMYLYTPSHVFLQLLSQLVAQVPIHLQDPMQHKNNY